MQYKGVAGFRESVAVGAQIWTAGTFAEGDEGPYFYTGDGTQNGAEFWTNSTGAPVPSLSGASRTTLVAVLGLAAGLLWLRSRQR